MASNGSCGASLGRRQLTPRSLAEDPDGPVPQQCCSRPVPPQPATTTSPPDTATIRQWAQANGVAVKDRGRIPASVVADYHQRDQAAL